MRFLTPALDAGLSTQTALPLVRELFVVGAHVGVGMILARAWIDGRFIRYFATATLLQAAVAYEAVLQVSGWPPIWSLVYLSAVAALTFFWGSSIATGRKLEGERLATRSIQLGLPLDFAAILAKPLAFDQLFIVASKKVECVGHRPVFDCPKVSATDTRLTMDLACLAMLRQVPSPR